MTYETIRHFADSYGLAAMVVLYLVLAFWALRPGARAHHDAAAAMIFVDETETEDADRNGSHG